MDIIGTTGTAANQLWTRKKGSGCFWFSLQDNNSIIGTGPNAIVVYEISLIVLVLQDSSFGYCAN